ncbi:MAG: hypothetical protein ACK40G_06140 [Cytophagaceae bacterium]
MRIPKYLSAITFWRGDRVFYISDKVVIDFSLPLLVLTGGRPDVWFQGQDYILFLCYLNIVNGACG